MGSHLYCVLVDCSVLSVIYVHFKTNALKIYYLLPINATDLVTEPCLVHCSGVYNVITKS